RGAGKGSPRVRSRGCGQGCRGRSRREQETPAVYFPLHPGDYAQPSLRGVTLMVRAVPGVDVISAVRREISAMDTSLTPFNARSMAVQISQFMSALKAASWTYGLIGVFGLILASVGLASVQSSDPVLLVGAPMLLAGL